MRLFIFGLLCMTALGGCVPDEEEIQAEFDAFTASRKDCVEDTDCTSVYPGCPLGCYVSVAKEHAAAVEKKAEELIDDYERGGRTCDYDCVTPPEPTCSNGTCE